MPHYVVRVRYGDNMVDTQVPQGWDRVFMGPVKEGDRMYAPITDTYIQVRASDIGQPASNYWCIIRST